ncbi:uncharacterized protein LOC135471724 [Liolophura sinensis]|uniref:uncharacterized protein LOC135471724 n=1 Tax=Liolophura sinensis TaxID=3198878 RepID=UPI0031592C31
MYIITMVIKFMAYLGLFTLLGIPTVGGDNQHHSNDRAFEEEFGSRGVEIPVIILTLCVLLVCTFVLLSCLNLCTSKLKYNVTDEENQKITDEYAIDTSNFTILPDRAMDCVAGAPGYGTQTESSGINLSLSTPLKLRNDTIRIMSTSKFKRVSTITVPTSSRPNEHLNTVGKSGTRTKLFKRRRIRHGYRTGIRHIKPFRHTTKPHENKINTGAVRRQQVQTVNNRQPLLIRRARSIEHRPFTYRHVSRTPHRGEAVARLPARRRRARRVRHR